MRCSNVIRSWRNATWGLSLWRHFRTLKIFNSSSENHKSRFHEAGANLGPFLRKNSLLRPRKLNLNNLPWVHNPRRSFLQRFPSRNVSATATLSRSSSQHKRSKSKGNRGTQKNMETSRRLGQKLSPESVMCARATTCLHALATCEEWMHSLFLNVDHFCVCVCYTRQDLTSFCNSQIASVIAK